MKSKSQLLRPPSLLLFGEAKMITVYIGAKCHLQEFLKENSKVIFLPHLDLAGQETKN